MIGHIWVYIRERKHDKAALTVAWLLRSLAYILTILDGVLYPGQPVRYMCRSFMRGLLFEFFASLVEEGNWGLLRTLPCILGVVESVLYPGQSVRQFFRSFVRGFSSISSQAKLRRQLGGYSSTRGNMHSHVYHLYEL